MKHYAFSFFALSLLILFSGTKLYADQFGGPKGKKLKYSRFKEYLMDLNHENGTELSNSLEKRIRSWQGKEAQIDDICVMKVKF